MLPSPCGAVVLARASPHPPTTACSTTSDQPSDAIARRLSPIALHLCTGVAPIVGPSRPTFYGLGTAEGQCRTHVKIGGTRSPP